MELGEVVRSFALGIAAADSQSPQAQSKRSLRKYQPGIGPHTEPEVVRMVMSELKRLGSKVAQDYYTAVPYPANPRQKCDLMIVSDDRWAIEVKMARFRGDNGKPADEMLMHLISPYESDRSALTDCTKLAESGMTARVGILIYGFDHPDKRLDPAIDAFELLAGHRVRIGPRQTAQFDKLIHPVFDRGRVFGWEIYPDRHRH